MTTRAERFCRRWFPLAQLQFRHVLGDELHLLQRERHFDSLGVLPGLFRVAGPHQGGRDAGLRQRPAQHELAQGDVFGFGQWTQLVRAEYYNSLIINGGLFEGFKQPFETFKQVFCTFPR